MVVATLIAVVLCVVVAFLWTQNVSNDRYNPIDRITVYDMGTGTKNMFNLRRTKTMAMEISNSCSSYVSSYASTTDNKKKTTESSTTKEITETGSTTKKTAADELSYLSKKYSDYSIVAANYFKGMKYGSNATTSVAISPQFLSKMANDPELEREYEGYLADMQKIDKEFAAQQASRGWSVEQGWAIDKDGGISKWIIGYKDPNAKSHLQTMSENAEKIRKQNEEKKQEKVKIEEKRQADREEKKKLQEKLDEAGKVQFGDNWKGVVVFSKDDENAAVPKADKDNAGITGLNMDLKA